MFSKATEGRVKERERHDIQLVRNDPDKQVKANMDLD